MEDTFLIGHLREVDFGDDVEEDFTVVEEDAEMADATDSLPTTEGPPMMYGPAFTESARENRREKKVSIPIVLAAQLFAHPSPPSQARSQIQDRRLKLCQQNLRLLPRLHHRRQLLQLRQWLQVQHQPQMLRSVIRQKQRRWALHHRRHHKPADHHK